MQAELISVGTELLLGNIVNTNAAFLSRELAALGISVLRQSTVGDNADRLSDWVKEAKQRADLLIFTGGLGPTADDLTKETVAACYHDTLHFDAAEWARIEAYFARTGRIPTENNRKQAMLPQKGHKIENRHGTAPGVWFTDGDKQAILMPGVPHEMEAMWAESVHPVLEQKQAQTLVSTTLRVVGGESSIETKIAHLLERQNPTAAIYCKTGECEIRITARAKSEAEGKVLCSRSAEEFRAVLGDDLYDADAPGIAWTLVHILNEQKRTVAAAESCTGGMVAAQITEVPGASNVFGFGYVTYWEQAKAKMIGVNPAVVEQYNVVSGQVAAQMALGAKEASGADMAVGITGIAGPDGGDAVRPVGTVYVGVALGDAVWVQKLAIAPAGGRQVIRQRAAHAALDMLRRAALGQDVPGTQITAEQARRADWGKPVQ
jgi:nicotinamide-nucleotide amidase